MKFCCDFHESNIYAFMLPKWGCSSLSRKFMSFLILIFLVVCIVLHYSPSFSQITHYTHLEEDRFKATTEAHRRRIRFHGTRRRLPQCIIIGVRKCGTRALLVMLGLHSYIINHSSEVHFFDDDDQYVNGLEWYRKRMPYSFDNQVTIEKTPSYFVSKEAPRRIHAMNESIRLLLIVRDPVERVLSDYAQIAAKHESLGKPIVPFKQKVLTKEGEINENYLAIKISQYFVHLVRWLGVFKREQIHIVDGDKLIEDPYTELIKVEKFLDIPPRLTPWNFYYNQTKGFYCLRNETRHKCLLSSKGRKHPDVDEEVLVKLRNYFAPFNEQFYELVGQNFSWPIS